MAALRIAVIGGDGIGPEVIEQAIRVADAAVRHDGARPSSGTAFRGAPLITSRPAR